MKQYVLVAISVISVSCFSQEMSSYKEFEIVTEKLKITEIAKMKQYYNIKAINHSKDTVSVISYNRNHKLIRNKRSKKKLEVGKDYEFNLMKLNVKVVNGVPNIGHIIVRKDTLWSGNIVLDKTVKLKKTEAIFYESINSKGLFLYD